jgi:hypothetical protein
MTTDHINRWNNMTDEEFLSVCKHYRKFKGVVAVEHSININYIVKRCQNLGYEFSVGCCGRNYITKKDGQ